MDDAPECLREETSMLDWTSTQRNVAFACFASWTLDAFDFFILVFVLSNLAQYFHNSVTDVSVAIMLTLAVRPIGALLFGRMAEKYGRKPILMLNIVFFSLFELLSAWSPTFGAFLAFRIFYGIAMGGFGAWRHRWRWKPFPTVLAA